MFLFDELLFPSVSINLKVFPYLENKFENRYKAQESNQSLITLFGIENFFE